MVIEYLTNKKLKKKEKAINLMQNLAKKGIFILHQNAGLVLNNKGQNKYYEDPLSFIFLFDAKRGNPLYCRKASCLEPFLLFFGPIIVKTR